MSSVREEDRRSIYPYIHYMDVDAWATTTSRLLYLCHKHIAKLTMWLMPNVKRGRKKLRRKKIQKWNSGGGDLVNFIMLLFTRLYGGIYIECRYTHSMRKIAVQTKFCDTKTHEHWTYTHTQMERGRHVMTERQMKNGKRERERDRKRCCENKRAIQLKMEFWCFYTLDGHRFIHTFTTQ